MGDICLVSCLERVFPKKYSFGFGVTEKPPLRRGVRDELILKRFCENNKRGLSWVLWLEDPDIACFK